jgi:ribosomal protein L11 methyltransferase
VAVTVPAERAEQARAQLLELFPEGFEEVERGDRIELAAYTDPPGEERLRAAFGHVDVAEVPAEWADRWRSFHHGALVGALWVGPPWEEAPKDAVAVAVDPGRAFGTGGHATTRLCLELLQVVPRGSLVDAGCGSGVLAIAAAKLGFGPVIALDNDPAAVEAAAANARVNGVALDIRLADVIAEPLPSTDVAVANITGEALPWLPFRSVLVVASGYLESDDVVLPAYVRAERRLLDGWAADLFGRRS